MYVQSSLQGIGFLSAGKKTKTWKEPNRKTTRLFMPPMMALGFHEFRRFSQILFFSFSIRSLLKILLHFK
jgi:hypothetical protein